MGTHDGTATVHYLEHDRPVGTRRAYCCGNGDHSALWPNIAYFCPTCGTLWAREVFEFHFSYSPRCQLPWVIQTRRCAGCGDGLLLIAKDLEPCSPDLLARELHLLLKAQPC